MIKGYFGVPGVGKTTILIKEYLKAKNKLIQRYDNIYSVNVDIDGVEKITKEQFEKEKFTNSLILWDEITLDYDNRDFKNFSPQAREAWLLHRHFGSDIIYATQNYENVDKKIKDITMELWYLGKSVIPIFDKFTSAKRIYRNITINEQSSELTMGYRFCNFIESIMVTNFRLMYRPKYYKYFNTNEELSMKDRQEHYNMKPIKLNKKQKLARNLLKKLKGVKNVFKRKKKRNNKILDPNGNDFIITIES